MTTILVATNYHGRYGGDVTTTQLFIGAVVVVSIAVLYVLAVKAREWLRGRGTDKGAVRSFFGTGSNRLPGRRIWFSSSARGGWVDTFLMGALTTRSFSNCSVTQRKRTWT